jgi:hypothetical protein
MRLKANRSREVSIVLTNQVNTYFSEANYTQTIYPKNPIPKYQKLTELNKNSISKMV